MALDNRPLTALGASEQLASLAALPEDLWRKIASLARPPTVRALVAACPDASLRQVLRTDLDRAERAAFGLTQREAERLLVDPLRTSLARLPSINANPTRRQANAAFIGHIEDRIRSVGDYGSSSPFFDPDETLTKVRAFLAWGVDPDYVGDMGMTALMRIPTLAHQRYEEAQALAELLLTAGADPNKTDEHGLTPLAHAYAELPAVLESRLGLLDHRAATLCANLIPFFVEQSCRVLQYPSGEVANDDDMAVVRAHILTQQAAHVSFFGGKTFLDATTQYIDYFNSSAGNNTLVIPGGDDFVSVIFHLRMLTRSLLPAQAAADGEDDQGSGGDGANGD